MLQSQSCARPLEPIERIVELDPADASWSQSALCSDPRACDVLHKSTASPCGWYTTPLLDFVNVIGREIQSRVSCKAWTNFASILSGLLNSARTIFGCSHKVAICIPLINSPCESLVCGVCDLCSASTFACLNVFVYYTCCFKYTQALV